MIYRYIIILIFAVTFSTLFATEPRKGECINDGKVRKSVMAVAETAPLPQDIEEDSADDPAIWENKENPSLSIVFGTDKKGGIGAYDLSGNLLKYYAVGRINNIDIRQACLLDNKPFDILAGSNRSDSSIIVFKIMSSGELELLTKTPIKSKMTDEVYGFCLYRNDDCLSAIVNSKSGEMEQWRLIYNSQINSISGELLGTHKFSSQVEGMVADDEFNVLYVGEEELGIWRIDLTNNCYKGTLIPKSQVGNNSDIVYDIEGLAIYKTGFQTGYLLASIQGNSTYAIFKREVPNDVILSFSIVKGENIDGVQETDGIDVFSSSLGSSFPNGCFVAQDGFNVKGDTTKESQNFKILDWRDIQKIME